MKGSEMAVPKSKISRSRRGQRRSHDSLKGINLVECSNCGEMKRQHNICPACGYYDGKEEVVHAIIKQVNTILKQNDIQKDTRTKHIRNIHTDKV